jgi:pyruvate formate lyase activating enzyme
LCGKKSKFTAESLRVCAECVRDRPKEALPLLLKSHARIRTKFGLPAKPPKNPGGVQCNICANECKIGEGEIGFCGLREVKEGRSQSLTSSEAGLLHSYLDPNPTNCCSAWFCPAGTSTDYPNFTYVAGPEMGYYNLAIFFYGCNFDCIYCQNASHKNIFSARTVFARQLVEKTKRNKKISCWCFFGGSPEPQLPFAINAAERALEEMPDRILRICFECNGCGHPKLVNRAARLALISGGNIKFDLKCFSESLSYAFSGVSNKRAYKNFRMIANDLYNQRQKTPVLTATTLLVPGYIDAVEIGSISKFIAELNYEIPYSLLVFHPDFMMKDLPVTPLNQVLECYKMAKQHLNNVNVGNLHMLGIKNIEELKVKASRFS